MMKPIMQWASLVCVLIVLGQCTLPSVSQGPTTWIDQPLDGSLLPVAPLTITAHASSNKGIQQVEFYSNLHSQAIAVVKGDGSALFEAQAEWNPPGPGTYHLSARAVDNAGGVGDQAWSTITVGVQFQTPLSVLPTKAPTVKILSSLAVFNTFTPTPTAMATLTPTPASPTLTPSSTPTPADTFTPTPGPTTLKANSDANCRTGPGVNYEVDDGLHKGQVGVIEGRTADNSWVWIREPSGGGGHCWVSASVGTLSGDLNLVLIIKAPPMPTQATPTRTPKPTYIVLLPPQVSIQVGDTTLETEGNPCSNHPTTTPVTAAISTSVKISKVILHWSDGQSGSESMQSTGGKNYKAILGSFSDPGTLSVWVSAVDQNGMEGASQTISVKITSACVQ